MAFTAQKMFRDILFLSLNTETFFFFFLPILVVYLLVHHLQQVLDVGSHEIWYRITFAIT